MRIRCVNEIPKYIVTNEVIYEMHQPRIKSEIKFKPTNERKDKWMFVKTNFWVSWGYFDVVSEFYVQIFVTNWVEKQCENCVHLFFGVAGVFGRWLLILEMASLGYHTRWGIFLAYPIQLFRSIRYLVLSRARIHGTERYILAQWSNGWKRVRV